MKQDFTNSLKAQDTTRELFHEPLLYTPLNIKRKIAEENPQASFIILSLLRAQNFSTQANRLNQLNI